MCVHSNDSNDFDFTFVDDSSPVFLLLLKRLGDAGQIAVGFNGFNVFVFLSWFFQKGSGLLCGASLVLSLYTGFTLGFFSRSSVFYCVSVCFKIREFFIYFIKIQAGGPLYTDRDQDGLEGLPSKGKTYVHKAKG